MGIIVPSAQGCWKDQIILMKVNFLPCDTWPIPVSFAFFTGNVHCCFLHVYLLWLLRHFKKLFSSLFRSWFFSRIRLCHDTKITTFGFNQYKIFPSKDGMVILLKVAIRITQKTVKDISLKLFGTVLHTEQWVRRCGFFYPFFSSFSWPVPSSFWLIFHMYNVIFNEWGRL